MRVLYNFVLDVTGQSVAASVMISRGTLFIIPTVLATETRTAPSACAATCLTSEDACLSASFNAETGECVLFAVSDLLESVEPEVSLVYGTDYYYLQIVQRLDGKATFFGFRIFSTRV